MRRYEIFLCGLYFWGRYVFDDVLYMLGGDIVCIFLCFSFYLCLCSCFTNYDILAMIYDGVK